MSPTSSNDARKRHLQCQICAQMYPYHGTDLFVRAPAPEGEGDDQQGLEQQQHDHDDVANAMFRLSGSKSSSSSSSSGVRVDPTTAAKTVERCIRRVRRLRYDLLQEGILHQPTQKYTANDPSYARIIAPLLDQEIQIGMLLGTGGFSSVYEVTAFTPHAEFSAPTTLANRGGGAPGGVNPQRCTPLEQGAREYIMDRVRRPARVSMDMDPHVRAALQGSMVSSYAIKHLRKGLVKDPALFQRAALDLALEAQLLLAMDHPHIVAMRGWSHHGVRGFLSGQHTAFFILLDRLPESLEDRICQWRDDSIKYKARIKRSPWGKQKYAAKLDHLLGQRLHMAQQIASALQYMHRWRILNRDIKASNIGFDVDGVLKLFDFGLSRLLPPQQAGYEDCYRMSRVGTVHYMAPEVDAKRLYNESADVYSFGVTFWEMLSMSSPRHVLSNTPKKDLVSEAPERCPLPLCDCWPSLIQETLMACLTFAPERRPSMEQVQQVLELTMNSMGYHVHQDPTGGLIRTEAARRPSFRVDLTSLTDGLPISSNVSEGDNESRADSVTTVDDHSIVLGTGDALAHSSYGKSSSAGAAAARPVLPRSGSELSTDVTSGGGSSGWASGAAATATSSMDGYSSTTESDEEDEMDEDGDTDFDEDGSIAETEQFLVDPLDFHKMGLVGREEEVQALQNCLLPPTEAQQSRGAEKELVGGLKKKRKSNVMVLLSGESGAGKTRLAESVASTVANQRYGTDNNRGPLVVRGKFDLVLQGEPYMGVISACEDLLDRILQIQQLDSFRYQEIVDRLAQDIHAPEWALLVHMVPFFKVVMGDHLPRQEEPQGEENAELIENAKNQFQEIFRRLTRVIGQFFAPLVLLMDDLQWADTSSLELMDQIMCMEPEESPISVIGLYRSNEVDASHVLTRYIAKWRNRDTTTQHLQLTEMTVGNLSEASVHRYLKKLLHMKHSENKSLLQALARICHKRTHGNIFFLISFVTMLHECKYLRFDHDTREWTWDIPQIEANTQSTPNAVPLLLMRMKALENTNNREVLRLMACLGSTCPKSILSILWTHMQATSNEDSMSVDEDLQQELDDRLRDLVEHQGFLNEISTDGGEKRFTWAHDKIHEAALMLTPEAERGHFQCRVGETIVEHLKHDEFDSLIFVVARLVSQYQGNDQTKMIRYADLQLQASQRATRLAAFENAKGFASRGLSFLPHNKWESCTQLCRDLYTNLMQAERICGDIPNMERHCREFLEMQKNEPIWIRLGAYHNLFSGIFYADPKGRGSEAIEIGFTALRELGCVFPTSKANILLQTLKCILVLKRIRKTLAESAGLLELPTMEGPRNKLEATKLLYAMIDVLYLAKDARMPLVIVRFIEITMEHGVTPHAPAAFALASALMTGVLNDLQGGAHYGRFALTLMKRVNYRPIVTGTIMMAGALGLVWTTHVNEVAKDMLISHDMGLRTGERKYGTIASFQYASIAVHSGKNLDTLAIDCRSYVDQARQDGVHLTADYLEYTLLAILSLKGSGADGVLQDIKNNPKPPNEDDPQDERDHFFLYWKNKFLATHMGDFETCAEASMAHKDVVKQGFPGSMSSMVEVPLRSLSCLIVSRRTGSSAALKEGKRLLAVVRDWVKQGNPNIVHFVPALEAELLAIQKKERSAVTAKYEDAIAKATQADFPIDAALFYECCGLYALEVCHDEAEATRRLEHAVVVCRGFGALGRIERMKMKYTHLLPLFLEGAAVGANTEQSFVISHVDLGTGSSNVTTLAPSDNAQQGGTKKRLKKKDAKVVFTDLPPLDLPPSTMESEASYNEAPSTAMLPSHRALS